MRLVIHREILASQVLDNVAEDGAMAGNSHIVGSGAYLQNMVVGLRHYAPRPTAPIPVSPPCGSGSGREGTDSYVMAVDIIPAGKKCSSVCYPLVLVAV